MSPRISETLFSATQMARRAQPSADVSEKRLDATLVIAFYFSQSFQEGFFGKHMQRATPRLGPLETQLLAWAQMLDVRRAASD